MLTDLLAGLALVFAWPTLGYLLTGIVFGIVIGMIPGLGTIIGLVILLPFTFGMEPASAFALLLGMYAVTSTSDTIASIMLGVPGSSASQATILDGYPLAKQGHAARALGAAFTVSAFGGVFGALVLAASLPVIRPFIQSFGSPEIFMLGLLGLTMVGSLSGGSIFKGLAAATLGLLLSTVGYSDSGAVPRYYFGSEYLIDGLPLIPIVLGLFALPELLELAIRNRSISSVDTAEVEGGSMFDGVKDAVRHWWLAVRCALMGTYIGMLPGLGASIVDWLAYGHAMQSAKDKSKFGHGDIRGVIAPEAANNATRGGSLVPTIAFGIPGSIGAAILLGALIIVGLKPGPEMLTSQLPVTFSMVWSIAVANIFATMILLVGVKQIAKIAFVPGHLIVPAVLMFIFMGAWIGGGSLGDWIACLVMGIVGFFMKRSAWPRPPLVLALVLGSIMENAYLLTNRVYDGLEWMKSPIVIIIGVFIIASLIFIVRNVNKEKKSSDGGVKEGGLSSPVFSLPLTLIMLTVFVFAILFAGDWPKSVKQFPYLLGFAGIFFTAIAVFNDAVDLRKVTQAAGGLGTAIKDASNMALLGKAGLFLLSILGMMALALVIGQKLALPIFMMFYLRFWGKYSWNIVAIYGVCSWVFMVLFYDFVMHLYWHESWLANLTGGYLGGLPSWLIF